jgi:hypothetical protein
MYLFATADVFSPTFTAKEAEEKTGSSLRILSSQKRTL